MLARVLLAQPTDGATRTGPETTIRRRSRKPKHIWRMRSVLSKAGRLAGKNILITGGNSGIGLAAAQEFDKEGARVAICGLNAGTLQAAMKPLGVGKLAVPADVHNRPSL